MRKFIVVFIMSITISSVGYTYSAPARACLLTKISSGIMPDQASNAVAFGIKLKCGAVNGNLPCSGVWYVLISDPNGNPVYYNALPVNYLCGAQSPKITNVITNPNWWGSGYTASQMVYDEATWLEVVSDGPVPL